MQDPNLPYECFLVALRTIFFQIPQLEGENPHLSTSRINQLCPYNDNVSKICFDASLGHAIRLLQALDHEVSERSKRA